MINYIPEITHLHVFCDYASREVIYYWKIDSKYFGVCLGPSQTLQSHKKNATFRENDRKPLIGWHLQALKVMASLVGCCSWCGVCPGPRHGPRAMMWLWPMDLFHVFRWLIFSAFVLQSSFKYLFKSVNSSLDRLVILLFG